MAASSRWTAEGGYPYSSHYPLGQDLINYMRNSVKVVIDAYDGTTTFYVFDPEDPILAAYRGIFPGLFKDAAAMPAGLRLSLIHIFGRERPQIFAIVKHFRICHVIQAVNFGLKS